jgi:hypothetical protein
MRSYMSIRKRAVDRSQSPPDHMSRILFGRWQIVCQADVYMTDIGIARRPIATKAAVTHIRHMRAGTV